MHPNPKMEYLEKLLDFYYSKDAGDFINSKIRNIKAKENNLFCYKCARKFILKVTCTAKLESERLIINCIKCKTRSEIMK